MTREQHLTEQELEALAARRESLASRDAREHLHACETCARAVTEAQARVAEIATTFGGVRLDMNVEAMLAAAPQPPRGNLRDLALFRSPSRRPGPQRSPPSRCSSAERPAWLARRSG